MEQLLFARWQFAITTVYHFLFVPLTLGLSILVAILHTQYYRTNDFKYRKMTKFWGQTIFNQLCVGGCHWDCAGISVRDELVGIFPLCRRHFRRAAGH